MHLLLIEPQPHERVRRGRELLHGPRAFADHGDELLARVGPRAGRGQELRRAGTGRRPERDQGPVPVRRQPAEQLVERRVRDLPRHPLRDPRAEQPRLLLPERIQRVVVRVRPPAPGQRERVHDRPRSRIQVVGVEAPADRLAVRRRRRRVLPRSRPGRIPQQAGTGGELEMSAEVPGLGPGRLVPRDAHRPAEPEPAQQRERVRPLRRRRTARRLQVPQVL